jgi:L-rhamnose-H+ transport protein
MVVGVIVCATAGRSEADQRSTTRFRKGLVVAILGGIGSPLLNIGIQFGISLLDSAPRLAVNAGLMHWVAWALFLSAAAIMQTGYCFYRVLTKGEQAAFTASGAGGEFGRVAIMAVAWSVSIFLYATAVAGLGLHGPSIGWPVFMALIVLMSNVWGVILGEWRNRPRAGFHKMLSGSALLIGATFLIAQGG